AACWTSQPDRCSTRTAASTSAACKTGRRAFPLTEHRITCAGREIPVYALDALVVGSGCAGFNAADSLYDLGRTDIAIVTEGVQMGTSRNTGSDKQTYYKLSLCGDAADSVQEMAETLFEG